MRRLLFYIKISFFATVVCLQAGVSTLVAQDRAAYSDLELYRQTLNQESTTLYQQALGTYLNTPRDAIHYSTNKQLCKHYHQLTSLPDSTAEQLNFKIEALRHLALEAAKQQEIGLQLRSLTDAFDFAFWNAPVSNTTAFILALEIESILDTVTDKEYTERRATYFKLGEAYYLHNEFEKSIAVLKKSITEQKPSSFTDRANLDSRKIIGICYANIGQIDTSDYYFRSILESTDIILDRPLYNAYALSYLGCNAMIRGNYTKALALDSEVLPFFQSYSDYGHLAGMYYCRAQCYAATKDMKQLQIATDSILYFANQDNYNRDKRRKQAFTMLVQYHALQGNPQQTQAFSDSLVAVYKKEASAYTSEYIANARQVISERQTFDAETKASIYRKNMLIGIFASMLFSLLSGYIYIQYRRLRSAYRSLAEKSRLWAEQIPKDYNLDSKQIPDTATGEEFQLMQAIHTYVITDKNYLDTELSLDKVAQELNINRSYISSTINTIMGKNFKSYVNEYRISEAIRLLNINENEQQLIEDLFVVCGFKNKRSLYNNFKKITALTPVEYLEYTKEADSNG